MPIKKRKMEVPKLVHTIRAVGRVLCLAHVNILAGHFILLGTDKGEVIVYDCATQEEVTVIYKDIDKRPITSILASTDPMSQLTFLREKTPQELEDELKEKLELKEKKKKEPEEKEQSSSAGTSRKKTLSSAGPGSSVAESPKPYEVSYGEDKNEETMWVLDHMGEGEQSGDNPVGMGGAEPEDGEARDLADAPSAPPPAPPPPPPPPPPSPPPSSSRAPTPDDSEGQCVEEIPTSDGFTGTEPEKFKETPSNLSTPTPESDEHSSCSESSFADPRDSSDTEVDVDDDDTRQFCASGLTDEVPRDFKWEEPKQGIPGYFHRKNDRILYCLKEEEEIPKAQFGHIAIQVRAYGVALLREVRLQPGEEHDLVFHDGSFELVRVTYSAHFHFCNLISYRKLFYIMPTNRRFMLIQSYGINRTRMIPLFCGGAPMCMANLGTHGTEESVRFVLGAEDGTISIYMPCHRADFIPFMYLQKKFDAFRSRPVFSLTCYQTMGYRNALIIAGSTGKAALRVFHDYGAREGTIEIPKGTRGVGSLTACLDRSELVERGARRLAVGFWDGSVAIYSLSHWKQRSKFRNRATIPFPELANPNAASVIWGLATSRLELLYTAVGGSTVYVYARERPEGLDVWDKPEEHRKKKSMMKEKMKRKDQNLEETMDSE